MKILNLKMRGFIGIRDGLGLEEIDLDLRNIDGLVAINGKNGTGKTTVLESLQPYRSVLSEARPSALFHHVYLKDSFRDLTFELNDIVYRTIVNINASTGASEGLIYVGDDTKSIVDGKNKSYDKFIAKLFGSKKLFTNSVFCAQDSGKISDLTTSQFKALLTEMLPIDRLAANEATSKNCIRIVSSIKSHTESAIKQLERQIENAGDVRSVQEENEQELSDATATLSEITLNIENLSKKLDEYKVVTIKNAHAKEAILENRDRIKQLESEIENESLKSKNAVRDLKIEIADIINDINKNKEIIRYEPQISEAREGIRKASNSIGDLKSAINALNRDAESVNKNIYEYEKLKDKARHQIKLNDSNPENTKREISLNNTQKSIANNRAQLEALDQRPELLTQNMKIEQAKREMSTLDQRDESCESVTCSFIKSAVDAKESLPKLLEERDAMLEYNRQKAEKIKDRIESYEKSIVTIEKSMQLKRNVLKQSSEREAQTIQSLDISIESANADLSNLRKLIGRHEHQIEMLQKEIEELEDILKYADKMDAAKRRNTQLEIRLSTLKKEIEMIERNQEESIPEKIKKVKILEEKNVSLNDMIDKEADDIFANTKDDLQFHKEKKIQAQSVVDILKDRQSSLKSLAEQLTKDKAELAKLKERYARQKKEHADWTHLRDACSKNGLQSLEIDGAAPLIANYANMLLLVASPFH